MNTVFEQSPYAHDALPQARTAEMRLLLLTSPMVGVGLSTLLCQRWKESHTWLCSCSDPKQISLKARQWQPDVTLLDADHLPLMQFIGSLGREQIRELGNILILTAQPSEQELFQAMRYGAIAYLSAFLEPDLLLSAIEAVHQGRRIFDSDVLCDPILLGRRQKAEGSRQALEKQLSSTFAQQPVPNCLTEEEQQMLLLTASGRANKELAATLGLSLEGVKRRFTAMYAKLNVFSRTEAVVLAMRYGWISVDAMLNKKETRHAS